MLVYDSGPKNLSCTPQRCVEFGWFRVQNISRTALKTKLFIKYYTGQNVSRGILSKK